MKCSGDPIRGSCLDVQTNVGGEGKGGYCNLFARGNLFHQKYEKLKIKKVNLRRTKKKKEDLSERRACTGKKKKTK